MGPASAGQFFDKEVGVMLIENQTEVCFLCEGEIRKGESTVLWERDDGKSLYSHSVCHHEYMVLTENYHYTQQQACHMLSQHILVFVGRG